jgi:hypothetical protein
MGNAYSVARNRPYTQGELADLNFYNDHCGAYLWAVLGLVLILFTVARLVADTFSRRRRHLAAEAVRGKPQLIIFCDARLGKLCSRHIPSTVLAISRKVAINQPRFIRALHLGTIGHVGLLAGYFVLNMILLFAGGRGDIDWIAHHAANLSFANLRTSLVPFGCYPCRPRTALIIGLSSRNNLVSLATGIGYESLNGLHRWTARVFVILNAIHIGGRIYINAPNANPAAPGGGCATSSGSCRAR